MNKFISPIFDIIHKFSFDKNHFTLSLLLQLYAQNKWTIRANKCGPIYAPLMRFFIIVLKFDCESFPLQEAMTTFSNGKCSAFFSC